MAGNSSENKPGMILDSSYLSRGFRITIRISIIAIFVISLMDLAGWIFSITLFKSIMPQWGPMKIITAVCFIFAATALLVIHADLSSIVSKTVSVVSAFFISIVSLVTLYVYIYFMVTGNEPSFTGVPFFGFFLPPEERMAFLTSINFLLIGGILFILPSDKTKASGIAHAMVIPVTLVSYFFLISYILDIYSVTEVNEIPVALNTGLAFCGTCTAILLLRSDTWLLKVFTSSDTGGIIARRLLPPLMILPVVIGWVRIHGERVGLFKSEEGVILVAITYTVCFLIIVWFTARSINSIDRKRQASEEELKKNETRLKELNTTKDKFFNIVAHDLKNPFTSLLGSSELLFQNINQMDHEQIKTLALILNDSAKSGYAILQNLLDWSRSQTGLLKFNPERINLRDLIDEHISNLEQISANKEIKMFSGITEDIYILADRNMIKTILRNLLSNAIKYSFRHGKVVVSANIEREQVIISVKDTGIGIPEDMIDRLFRIETKNSMPGTENEQGTGLGLKLCKEFVEKMNGAIWVESIENKGSEFKFSVSLNPANLIA
jgi:signal transduction histidine kinase